MIGQTLQSLFQVLYCELWDW